MRVFVTGSTTGLGKAAAAALLAADHQVVVHGRSEARLEEAAELLERGAEAVVGDLAQADEVRDVAEQVNRLGRMDAVIHNAGVVSGRAVLAVNVVAPYLLTALVPRPARIVYLSSGMHAGGRTRVRGLDWAGTRGGGSYSDSKLFVTALMAAVAERWHEVASNAVDPGWVPTRMGGPGAPDDLTLGHVTQVWLASSDDPEASTSGGYWYHQRRREPHRAVRDPRFQRELLDELERFTGVPLG